MTLAVQTYPRPRWLTSTVVDLAEAIRQTRDLERLPILADAARLTLENRLFQGFPQDEKMHQLALGNRCLPELRGQIADSPVSFARGVGHPPEATLAVAYHGVSVAMTKSTRNQRLSKSRHCSAKERLPNFALCSLDGTRRRKINPALRDLGKWRSIVISGRERLRWLRFAILANPPATLDTSGGPRPSASLPGESQFQIITERLRSRFPVAEMDIGGLGRPWPVKQRLPDPRQCSAA